MKPPRAALLVALMALAVIARAEPTTSLAGWTAFKALYAVDPTNPTRGSAYEDGVVYCDVGTPKAPKFPPPTALLPAYDCVVVGRARTQVGPKIGGAFFRGKAWMQMTAPPKGPVLSAPGSPTSNWVMLLKIDEKRPPYAARTVILTAGSPAESSQFTSYVQGGDHLNALPGGVAGVPSTGQNGSFYWCNPKDGKVTFSTPKRAAKGSHKVAKKNSPCAVGQKPPVVAKPERPADKPGTVVAAGPTALAAIETRWLTRKQRETYELDRKNAKDAAASKKLDDDARLLVEKQIRPEVASAYKKAYGESAEAVAKAIGSVEMWGGDETKVTAVVAPFQEKPDAKMLEIQLSKADWDALQPNPKEKDKDKETKKAAALKKYLSSRGGSDGNSGTNDAPKFESASYDAVKLHLVTVDALVNGLGKTPGTAPAKVEPPVRTILSQTEIDLLTPKEKEMYQGYLDRAKKDGKFDPTDKNLLDNAELLRNRMNSENPRRSQAKAPPSSADMTAEQFAAMTLPQKRKFCVDYPVDIAVVAKDANAPVLDNVTTDAIKGAKNSTGAADAKPKPATDAADTKWSKKDRIDACRKLPPENVGEINPGTPKPKEEGSIAGKVNGVDKDKPDEKKNSWLTAPLITAATRGSLVGLIIGSLFGPVGLIAGPIIGAAFFYGLGKYEASKSKDE